MNWPLTLQMTGLSVFGGLDSGLDCGTGLWDWTVGLKCGTGLRESCAHHFG